MAAHNLTRELIDAYAELTSDRNPLHVDEEFAEASSFGGIIAHGFLLLGGPLNELAATFEHPLRFACRFEAPGRPGDSLTTEVSGDGEEREFVVSSSRGALVVGTFGPASTADHARGG